MAPTVILECSSCAGLMLAPRSQKTRTCPYCGVKVDLKRAKRIASAASAIEASEMLRKLKAERQDNSRREKKDRPLT